MTRSSPRRRVVSNQWPAWTAFAAAHAIVVGQALANPAMLADVDLYVWWIKSGLHDGQWPVLSASGPFASWVYPVVALLPMLLAAALGPLLGTHLAWLAVSTAASAVAFHLLRSRGSDSVSPWYWLVFIVFAGPIALARLDIWVAVLICAALCIYATHPKIATVLLALGAWIKVVPGLVLWPLFATVGAGRDANARWRQVVFPAVAVCAVVLAVTGVFGAAVRAFSFLAAQTDRGLQVESVGASIVQLTGRQASDVVVAFNDEISTYEVSGGATQSVLTVVPWVLIAATAMAMVLIWIARRAGAEVMAWGALALLSWAIIGNKVGSPQFQMWLIAPIAFGLLQSVDRRRWQVVAGLSLASALLTQLVYPLLYDSLLELELGAVILLAVRNATLVTIGLIAMWALWGLRQGARAKSVQTATAP